jgi:hypothetical protein
MPYVMDMMAGMTIMSLFRWYLSVMSLIYVTCLAIVKSLSIIVGAVQDSLDVCKVLINLMSVVFVICMIPDISNGIYLIS